MRRRVVFCEIATGTIPVQFGGIAWLFAWCSGIGQARQLFAQDEDNLVPDADREAAEHRAGFRRERRDRVEHERVLGRRRRPGCRGVPASNIRIAATWSILRKLTRGPVVIERRWSGSAPTGRSAAGPKPRPHKTPATRSPALRSRTTKRFGFSSALRSTCRI